jgi:hypothetical protein
VYGLFISTKQFTLSKDFIMGLQLTGVLHGYPQATPKGYILRVLTGDSLIKVFTKKPDSIQPDKDGNVSILVSAADDFVFAN